MRKRKTPAKQVLAPRLLTNSILPHVEILHATGGYGVYSHGALRHTAETYASAAAWAWDNRNYL